MSHLDRTNDESTTGVGSPVDWEVHTQPGYGGHIRASTAYDGKPNGAVVTGGLCTP